MSDGNAPRRRPRPPPVGLHGVRRKRRWMAYVPLALVGAIVLVLLRFLGVVVRWFLPAGAEVVVPKFVGMPYAQADAAAVGEHIGLRVVARRPDYHVERDLILGQLPAAGQHVREGRTVEVIVSDGIPSVKVPNVSEVPLREATIALQNARLEVGKVADIADAGVPEGTVIASHPEVFSIVPAGSKVDLSVAKGRRVVRLPDFTGLPLWLARRAARDLGIRFDVPKFLPIVAGAKPSGTVIAQKPQAGQTLTPKQNVALQVSGGAPPTPEPLPSDLAQGVINTSPQPATSPTSALPSPNAVRGMRVVVTLPAYRTTRRVRIELLDATGARTLYERKTTGGVTLSFDVVISGTATVETYADDALVSATPL